MKKLLILLIGITFSQCNTQKTTTVADVPDVVSSQDPVEITTYEEVKFNKGKNVIVTGILVQEEFVNKGGRATGVFETLLKLSDGETVHIRNKGENKYDYENLKDKKVKLNAIIFYGGIDSDNPEHQSRVGYRIDYNSITVID